MATITQRYFPGTFSIAGTGVTWASGQAWASGASTDWATCTVTSGQVTSQITFRDFGISVPQGYGVAAVRVIVTGLLSGSVGDGTVLKYQLSDGANLVGDTQIRYGTGTSFTTPATAFAAATAATSLTFATGYTFYTNRVLTHEIIAASGFGIAVSGTFNQPPADIGSFPTKTGSFKMASIALDVDFESITKFRTKGQTISRMGIMTRKE